MNEATSDIHVQSQTASPLMDLIRLGEPVIAHRPWPRIQVGAPVWQQAIDRLADGSLTLLGLWGEPHAVHMALFGAGPPNAAVLSIACPDKSYPSVGLSHAPAIRLERAIRDLYGLHPTGLTDLRPWLDHGCWADQHSPAASYPFLAVQGDALHQIPVGPVHAGIIEPGHFRFTCDGETVVRLEQRLGYVHKGVDMLMAGASLPQAARLAGRVSGDSTVAYALALPSR